jgi:hypothetical protein
VVCYVIICSILNHILDFSYFGERIYFGFIEERYEKSARYARKIVNNLVKGRIMRNKAMKGVWKERNNCTI